MPLMLKAFHCPQIYKCSIIPVRCPLKTIPCSQSTSSKKFSNFPILSIQESFSVEAKVGLSSTMSSKCFIATYAGFSKICFSNRSGSQWNKRAAKSQRKRTNRNVIKHRPSLPCSSRLRLRLEYINITISSE